VLPLLVPVPHWVLLCIQGPHPDSLDRWVPTPDQTVHWCLVGWFLLAVQGMYPGDKGGEKPPSPQSWIWVPRDVAGIWNRDNGHWGNSTGSNILLCQHRVSGFESKGWAPRVKDLTSYTLASRLQKQKAKFNLYIIACNSIVYCTPPVLCDFSMFRFLKFYLSAMPSLPH
jgi:hypothetical protein